MASPPKKKKRTNTAFHPALFVLLWALTTGLVVLVGWMLALMTLFIGWIGMVVLAPVLIAPLLGITMSASMQQWLLRRQFGKTFAAWRRRTVIGWLLTGVLGAVFTLAFIDDSATIPVMVRLGFALLFVPTTVMQMPLVAKINYTDDWKWVAYPVVTGLLIGLPLPNIAELLSNDAFNQMLVIVGLLQSGCMGAILLWLGRTRSSTVKKLASDE